MSEATKHSGGCHCGKVRYEVTLDLEKPAISCNCSMCGRSGTLLLFVPATDFELLSGEDVLTDYKFNKEVISHLFCSVCGIKAFALGGDKVAVNVRCLDDFDLTKAKVKLFDGKSR